MFHNNTKKNTKKIKIKILVEFTSPNKNDRLFLIIVYSIIHIIIV